MESNGRVSELVDDHDSKSCGFKSREGSSPSSPTNKNTLAYVVGIAIGDGNLSNPNGRATRLRVTCDKRYPKLIENIQKAIQEILPKNKVSLLQRAETYLDISCYSQQWEQLLGWRVGGGTKIEQRVRIPQWIKSDPQYKISCLRGLIETDGSIYHDRGYKMVMFVTAISYLANDVYEMIQSLGFYPHLNKILRKSNPYNLHQKAIYHVRISKNVNEFLKLIQPQKL